MFCILRKLDKRFTSISKIKICIMAKKKIIQYSRCRKNSSEMIEEEEFKHTEETGKILNNNKTAYEKKIVLFSWH